MFMQVRVSQILMVVMVLVTVLLPQMGAESAAEEMLSGAGPKIYWSDSAEGSIWRANLDGSTIEKLLQIDWYRNPRALALDVRTETVYFVAGEPFDMEVIRQMDFDGNNLQYLIYDWQVFEPNTLAVDRQRNQLLWTDSGRDVIGRANLDGSELAVQFVPGPGSGSDMALDEVAGKIYWTDALGIFRSNVDGSDTQRLTDRIPTPVSGVTSSRAGRSFGLPTGIAIDEAGGKYYYTASSGDLTKYGVARANLDGSGAETIIPYSDGRSAGLALDPLAGKLYWSVSGSSPEIKRADLDGSDVEIVVSGLSAPHGLDLDNIHGKLYWADWFEKSILRANLDGSGVEEVVDTAPQRPRYLVVDAQAGKLFWTGDSGDAVRQANLDGSNESPLIGSGPVGTRGIVLDQKSGQRFWINVTTQTISTASKEGGVVEDIIIRRLYGPQGINVDEITGMMYWVDFETGKIIRSNDNGRLYQELVTEGLDKPTSLALDTWKRKMYWSDEGQQQIGRANLDGSGMELLLSVTDGLDRPGNIALDLGAGKMYWSDQGRGTISRANLDGSGIEEVISGLQSPSGLALSIDLPEIQRSYVPVAAAH
jgi:DNA-binding beta-propeller fold protein YncE